MKKFLIKFILLIILPFGLLDLFFQPFIDNKLAKSNLSNYREWNDILSSKINADLIIQGSSRAWGHISPRIIDSTFSINSYNLGIDGYDFDMQFYRFLLYLKHNARPKYILQNVDPLTLSKREDLYMPEQFIPYLKDDIIKEAVKNYKGFDDMDFYLPFLKYTHTPLTKELMLESFITLPVSNSLKYKGFQAQNLQWDSTFSEFSKSNPHGYRVQLNNKTQSLFEQYLKICRREHIQIVFVYSPEFIQAQKLLINRDSITAVFKQYAQKYNIPFLDYSSDSICNDRSDFYNSQHLNVKGVKIFNLILVHDLKKIIGSRTPLTLK